MEIKITINDGGGADVQYAPAAKQNQDAALAAAPQSSAAPQTTAPEARTQFSGGLNAGAAPAELTAPGARGAPMPFVEAVDDGTQPHAATETDGMSAGAAPSR